MPKPYAFPDFETDAPPRIPSAIAREIAHTRALARLFIEETVRPNALLFDQKVLNDPDTLPWDLVKAANRFKLYSLWLPKVLGGGGYHPLSLLAFNEELAAECLGIANLIGSHYVGLSLVSCAFNFTLLETLCRAVLEGEKSGNPCLVSTAITETNVGTDYEEIELIDRAHVTCRAERVSGGYKVTGSKVYISNGHLSKWHIVTGFLNSGPHSSGGVILAVSSDSPGFSLGRIERKMGQNACPASVLHFDGCFVPDALVCLAPEHVPNPLLYRKVCETMTDDLLSLSRPGVAALAAGVAHSAFLFCEKHFRESGQIEEEWAQALLTDLRKNTFLCQSLFWNSGILASAKGPFQSMMNPSLFFLLRILPTALLQRIFAPLLKHSSTRLKLWNDRMKTHSLRKDRAYYARSSLAKFAASDLAMESLSMALQACGEKGFRQEGSLEKNLRDAKLLQIYEGTNQLNRLQFYKHAVAREDAKVFQESPRLHQGKPNQLMSQTLAAVEEFSRRELGYSGPFVNRLEKLAKLELDFNDPEISLILNRVSRYNPTVAVALFSQVLATDASLKPSGKNPSQWFALSPFTHPRECSLKAEENRLSGQGRSVILTETASQALLLARTKSGATFFLVDLASSGITRSKPFTTLGCRDCHFVDLTLHEVSAIPLEELKTLARTPLAAGAISIGIARSSFDEALRYAEVRRQGGREIIGWSSVRLLLAEMQAKLETAEMALERATYAESADKPGENFEALGIHLQELALSITSDGIQVLGGAGYSCEFEQERRFRDAHLMASLLGPLHLRKLEIL